MLTVLFVTLSSTEQWAFPTALLGRSSFSAAYWGVPVLDRTQPYGLSVGKGLCNAMKRMRRRGSHVVLWSICELREAEER